MSMEAFNGFIKQTNHDADLGAMALKIWGPGPQSIDDRGREFIAFAGKHGFDFTLDEAKQGHAAILASGELPDVLLEQVAGGGGACSNGSLLPDCKE